MEQATNPINKCMPYTKHCPSSCNDPIKILIVDDNPLDVRLIVESMKESRIFCCISSVGNGIEFLQYMRKEEPFEFAETPDIIFLDVNMPKMDGKEALAELRSDPELKHHVVVILTTSSNDQDILESYKLQCQAYAVKSVDLDEFRSMMESIGNFYFNIVKVPPKK